MVGLAPLSAYGQVTVRPLSPRTPGPFTLTYGQSIGAGGTVAIGYSHGTAMDVPTVWTRSGTTYSAQLLSLPSGQVMGAASAINGSRLITGYTQPSDGNTATATIWTPSGSTYTPALLPDPIGAIPFTAGYAVNASGQVAGFALDENGASVAATWTPTGAGGAYVGTLLSFPGRSESGATAVNSLGHVAGYTLGPNGLRGAVWENAGSGLYLAKEVISNEYATISAINDFGMGAGVYNGDQPLVMVNFENDYYAMNLDMPFGSTDGASNAVNNQDALVGYVKDNTTATSGAEAALWLPTETGWEYINLDAWFDQANPNAARSWILQEAFSISDDWLVTGTALFGQGTTVERGFVLDVSTLVPEPASGALLAVAVPLLLRRRRRV